MCTEELKRNLLLVDSWAFRERGENSRGNEVCELEQKCGRLKWQKFGSRGKMFAWFMSPLPFLVPKSIFHFPTFFLVFSPIFYEKCRGEIQWKFHSATSLVASTHGNSCESHNSSLGPIQNVWNGGEDEILFYSRLLLPLPTKNPSLAAILIKENLVTLTPLIHSWHFETKIRLGPLLMPWSARIAIKYEAWGKTFRLGSGEFGTKRDCQLKLDALHIPV